MDFFVWKDGFCIGIKELDQQHRSFLELLNESYTKASQSKIGTADAALIQRLKTYAAQHFRFEETLMRNYEYGELELQERQHKYFVLQIGELEKALAAGSGTSIQSVLSLVRDWFLEHILTQDKKFASYVEASKPKSGPGR